MTPPVIVAEPQQDYWAETTRRIAVENHRDRAAARKTNAAFLLVNEVPFGTPRRSLP